MNNQDKTQNTIDNTADEVTEAKEEVQDTESVIEEPKIETPVEESSQSSAVSSQPEEEDTSGKSKESLSYDELPSEAPTIPAEKPATVGAADSQSLSDFSEEASTDDNPNAKWYVVHTYSGHENKVASALKQRIESEHLEHKIIDVLVPTQDKIEIKAGKKENVKEKIFPGYILVKMVLDDGSWLAVRTTQGVTSFVGIGNKPTPIPEHEVKTIVRFMSQGATSTFKDVYQINDTIKIIDGPFSDFIGKVDTVDKEKGKVRVLVSIFGRETPVELDFLQVQKL